MPAVAPAYCLICARLRRPGEWACTCGGELWAAESPPGDYQAPEPERGPLRGPLEGVDVTAGIVLLHGPPGSRKTTTALQAAPGAPWWSSEMHPGPLRAYAERLGVRAPLGIRPLPLRLVSWMRDAPIVVLDSAPQEWEDLGELDAWRLAHGVDVVILITQETKDHRHRGSAKIAHQAEAVIRVNAGRMVVTKNRSGPTFDRKLVTA